MVRIPHILVIEVQRRPAQAVGLRCVFRYWIRTFEPYAVNLSAGGFCDAILNGTAATNTEYPIVETVVYAEQEKEWNQYLLRVRLAHAKEYKRYDNGALVTVPVAGNENIRLIVELRDPEVHPSHRMFPICPPQNRGHSPATFCRDPPPSGRSLSQMDRTLHDRIPPPPPPPRRVSTDVGKRPNLRKTLQTSAKFQVQGPGWVDGGGGLP